MKKIILLTFLLSPLLLFADGWQTLYPDIERAIRRPVFPDREFRITDFGARSGAPAAKNRKAIERAIEKCSAKGGGRVVVPEGVWHTGAIRLRSGVNLVVEKGAVLKFVFQPELYPVVPTRWEGLDCRNLSPCIYAYKEKDVALTGEGSVDGGGSNETWWKWCGAPRYGWKEGIVSQRNGSRARLLRMAEESVDPQERTFGPEDGLRPQLVNFNQCDGVLVEDVTLLDSPFWVIHPLLSSNVTIRGVTINNDGPNGDGCDPESCDGVLIENCFFNTGDDCIAIKSGRNNDGRRWNRPSQNIIIRGCEMRNGHGGVVIGSEISGGCRNVFAENNVMDSPDLDRVVRIKTNTCRGGVIENIYVRNTRVGQCRESVLKINLDYERNEICCRGFIPMVRNVNLDNVNCDKSRYGVQIIALDTVVAVSDINVRNCRFDGVADGNRITGKTARVNLDNCLVNGSLSLMTPPFGRYSEWMTASEMRRTPRSYLLDFSKKPKWSYVMGIELGAMLDTYLRYGDRRILDYCREYTDTMINADGSIRGYCLKDYNLDNVRTGHFVAKMYQVTPEEKIRKALLTLMRQMREQPRTEEGVYWHKAIYAWQVWLDGIFMGLPVSTLTAGMLSDAAERDRIYDDAIDQVIKTYRHTLDTATGLNRHAWDETRTMFWADPATGLSQHCWGRAQGWFAMALVELLDNLPADHPRREEVVELLDGVLGSVMRWQDSGSGVWWQVMDAPGREGNYLEATASSMFAYALLKAYSKGYSDASRRDAGIRAFRGIVRNFIKVNPDSTLSLTGCCSVAGLGPGGSEAVLKAAPHVKENRRRDGSYAYYLSEPVRDNDAKGIGPFIWAALEMERLGYDIARVGQPIDRHALTARNNPVVERFDTLASLSVGNGRFAATVDFTGLQSFPREYSRGIPLCTMSDWGWHSFPDNEGLAHAETLRTMNLGHGHEETYAVEYKDSSRNARATSYFRVNPHRLNLGHVGLRIRLSDGSPMGPGDAEDIRQELSLWDGKIESSFFTEGEKTEVTTACTPDRDCLFTRVKSDLLADGRASVAITFPYPTGMHADDASDYSSPSLHESRIVGRDAHRAVIERRIDSTLYYALVEWEGEAVLKETGAHCFELSTPGNVLCAAVTYSPSVPGPASEFSFDQALKATMRHWPSFWSKGATVDFSACTDPRARELERRVVLSQYLTAINCASSVPPQETGLTYNSWYGRPHLEMTWWHTVHFSLWNRPEKLRDVLGWYASEAAPKAREIAARQGFKGVRWMKMTDPQAGEAPSNTGSFLIWQQPHFIYMAEEAYRADPSEETLRRYAPLVEATAEFMADYAMACAPADPERPIKLFGQTAMQESMSKDFSLNHPFELAYWRYGLAKAQQWLERCGRQRDPLCDSVINRLSPLPENEGLYVAGEPVMAFDGTSSAGGMFDPYATPDQKGSPRISEEDFMKKSHSDHPAVLGACGLLPDMGHYDAAKMRRTLTHVTDSWNWPTTWGWDYGMIAMCAARIGEREKAVDALLTGKGKNTYLISGHNFQEPKRLRLYLPGNGSLLDAVAMMCAGWDGCPEPLNPGFPSEGWDVRWEGLRRMQ